MALDLDELPYYDPLLKKGTEKMSDVWIGAFSTFCQSLAGYLGQNGMFLPVLTTEQEGQIQSPVFGQIIYNSDLKTARYYREGSPSAWVSFP